MSTRSVHEHTASVVVRSKNEEASIEATLRSLRRQSVANEIVLVDSGSTDRTLDMAKPYVDVLVQIPPQDFSFGGALNVGARHASGSVVFALSAHCVAQSSLWVAQSLEHYDDPDVAGTCGWDITPQGTALASPRAITVDDILLDPHGRFSNHACSWRKATWEQFPFDATLRSAEDQDWLWRVMLAGWKVIADPRLMVDTGHRRAAGLWSLGKREYYEHRVIAERLVYRTPSLFEVAHAWWSFFPWPSEHPRWQRRLSPWRTVEIAAGFVGEQIGRRQREGNAIVLPRSLPIHPQ